MTDDLPPDTDTDDLALRRALRGLGGTPTQAPTVLDGLRPTLRRARRRHQAAVAVRTGTLGALVLFGAAAVNRSLGDDGAAEIDVVSPDLPVTTDLPPASVDIGDGLSVDSAPIPTSTTTTAVGGMATAPTPAMSAPAPTVGSGPVSGPTSTAAVPPASAAPPTPTTAAAPPATASPGTSPSDDDTSDDHDDDEPDHDSSGSGSGGSGTPPASPQTQVVASNCGTATFSWTASQVSLVSTAPGPGFPPAEVDLRSATEISVTFDIDDGDECQIEARIENGTFVPRVDNS